METAEDAERHWKTRIPTQTDLEELEEKLTPSMHYYICTGRKQLTIQKAWNTYYVRSRGWKPKHWKTRIRAGYYTLGKHETLQEAKKEFNEHAQELLNQIDTETEKKRKLNMELLIKETEE